MQVVNRRLPLWSKALACLVVLVVSSALYFATQTILGVRTIFVRATDANYMKQAMNQVGVFPDPLPDGFICKYAFTVDWAKSNALIFEKPLNPEFKGVAKESDEDEQEGQKIVIFSFLQETGRPVDPKETMLLFYDFGINTDTVVAKFTDMKKKDEIELGGLKMPYASGLLKDQTGRIYEGLVGCMRSEAQKKTLIVYAISAPGKALDFESCFDFLKSIKSF
jgi:hypothetical protein